MSDGAKLTYAALLFCGVDVAGRIVVVVAAAAVVVVRVFAVVDSTAAVVVKRVILRLVDVANAPDFPFMFLVV